MACSRGGAQDDPYLPHPLHDLDLYGFSIKSSLWTHVEINVQNKQTKKKTSKT